METTIKIGDLVRSRVTNKVYEVYKVSYDLIRANYYLDKRILSIMAHGQYRKICNCKLRRLYYGI